MIDLKPVGGGKINITGEATISEVEVLYEKLTSILDGIQEPLFIDLDELTDIDTAGAQVFIALRKTLGSNRVTFGNASDAVHRALQVAGLEPLLF